MGTGTPEEPRCRSHDADVVSECASCGRGLCDICWQRSHGQTGKSWCEPCIAHSERTWPWAMPLLTVSSATLALVAAMKYVPQLERWWQAILGGGILLLASLGWYSFAIAKRRREAPGFVPRSPDRPPQPAFHRGGYRDPVRHRRPALGVLPPLSADETLLTALGALLAIAALGLFTLDWLPPWLRFEALVLALGAVVTATLTWVVYRGHAVADDAPIAARGHKKKETLPHHALMFLVALFAPTGPGVLAIVALSIPIFVGFGLMWAVAIVFPLAYLLTYSVLGRGLVAASRLHRHKAGDLPAALQVGVVGGLVVALPLAGLFALGHWVGLQL